MSWYRPPSNILEPSHPFMPERGDFLVGSGEDAGYFLTRFDGYREFGGKWVLSEEPYPSLKVSADTLSAVYDAASATDGGRVWFHGDTWDCYPVRGNYIIASAGMGPGYWPDYAVWYDGEDVRHTSGDGWFAVDFPARYTEETTARAAGVYQYDRHLSGGLGPVSMFWPRWTWGTLQTSTNPCRVYSTARDGVEGTKTVGLATWAHGEDTFTQSMHKDETSAHWADYGKAKWTSAASAYVIGHFGYTWQEADPPTKGQSWRFSGWTSGEGGASAVPSANFTATWQGYAFGDAEHLPIYSGQIEYFA